MKNYVVGIDKREIDINADRIEARKDEPAKFYQGEELVTVFETFDYIIDVTPVETKE